MVTTLLLPLELEIEAGLRHSGRILVPEKSQVMLPPAKGERKQVEREALEEEEVEGEEERAKVLLGFIIREDTVGDANMRLWNPKLDAVAVATAMDGGVGLWVWERGEMKKISKWSEVVVVGFLVFECLMGHASAQSPTIKAQLVLQDYYLKNKWNWILLNFVWIYIFQ